VISSYPNLNYFSGKTFCFATLGSFRLVANRVMLTIFLALLLGHFAPNSVLAGCGVSLEDGWYVRHLSSSDRSSSDSFSKSYMGRIVYFDGRLLLSTSLADANHDTDSTTCLRCRQLPGTSPLIPSLTSAKPIQPVRAAEGISLREKDISILREIEPEQFAMQDLRAAILRPPIAT
jgi:hypothetical protein